MAHLHRCFHLVWLIRPTSPSELYGPVQTVFEWHLLHSVRAYTITSLTGLFHGYYFNVTVGKTQVSLIKWMMAGVHVAAVVSGSWYCACRFTGTLEWNRAIVAVINNTCPFPAMTSKGVYCEEGLLALGVWSQVIPNIAPPSFSFSRGLISQSENTCVVVQGI